MGAAHDPSFDPGAEPVAGDTLLMQDQFNGRWRKAHCERVNVVANDNGERLALVTVEGIDGGGRITAIWGSTLMRRGS